MAFMLVALALASCDEKPAAAPPNAQEFSETDIGHFCGMTLAEHPGPKGQVFLADKTKPIWFATVRETFAFTMLPEEPKNITAIYVSDMGKATSWQRPEPGTWIDAKRAFYVIGSARQGGMGTDEAIPFGEEAQARRLAAESGGRVVTFAEMPEDFILQYAGSDAAAEPAAAARQQARTP
jgi:copper chaperone NosL